MYNSIALGDIIGEDTTGDKNTSDPRRLHSITFGDIIGEDTKGDKNTWDAWKLVPSSRPLFNPPAQKVKTLDIPGGDGVIDLSQSLTGYPVFQNRTGSFEFYVMNAWDLDIPLNSRDHWYEIYSDIMNYLHGQTMRAVLEDDPEYFYEGRFTVNSWKSDKERSKITIDYDVGPYKWSKISSIDDSWFWDPFNFKTGVIQNTAFSYIEVDKETNRDNPVILNIKPRLCDRAASCPFFITDIPDEKIVHLSFTNKYLGIIEKEFNISKGKKQIPEIVFFGYARDDAKDMVVLKLWTDDDVEANVSIEFRSGRL